MFYLPVPCSSTPSSKSLSKIPKNGAIIDSSRFIFVHKVHRPPSRKILRKRFFKQIRVISLSLIYIFGSTNDTAFHESSKRSGMLSLFSSEFR